MLPGNGSEKGIFARMLLELADQGDETDTLMIDVSRRTPCVRVSPREYLKTHRTATSMQLKKGGDQRQERPPDHCPAGDCEAICREGGRTKGGMNSKLHAVTDAAGRPLRMFLTAGQPVGILLRNTLLANGSAMTSEHAP